MLSPKIAKPEVCRHFTRWPTSPSWKSLKCYNSAVYHPILMKFGKQAKKNMQNPRNAKPEVCRHFPRWPPSWKSLNLLSVVHLSPDFEEIHTQTTENLMSSKNTKQRVSDLLLRLLEPLSWKRLRKVQVPSTVEKQQILIAKTAKPFKLSCYRPSTL